MKKLTVTLSIIFISCLGKPEPLIEPVEFSVGSPIESIPTIFRNTREHPDGTWHIVELAFIRESGKSFFKKDTLIERIFPSPYGLIPGLTKTE